MATPKAPLALRDVQGLKNIDPNMRQLLQALTANMLYVYGKGGNPAIFSDQYDDELSNIIGTGDTNVYASTTTTSDYTMGSNLNTLLVDASNNAITIKLPKLGGNKGNLYRIKRIDDSDFTVTIKGRSTATIDGTTQTLERQWAWMSVENTGSTWHIFSKEDGLSAVAEADIRSLRIESNDLNEQLLKQLKIMNIYFAEIVGDKINEDETED